ncbi:MAG TPA: ParB/RepB/Spo0J family partition protein [Alphaproteobacteria bacterium]|nr:ParB/RepB/Spo0J family partition protein [Alphaproteobacteria bacterium]
MSTDETPKKDETAREKADAAAQRAAEMAGLSLGSWLNQAIAAAAADEGAATSPANTTADDSSLPEEARRAVEQAAAAAGVPIGAWLGRLLREASLEEEGATLASPRADNGDTSAPAAPLPIALDRAAAEAAAAAGLPPSGWLADLAREAQRSAHQAAPSENKGAGASPPPSFGENPSAEAGPKLPLRRAPLAALKPGRFQMRAEIGAEELAPLVESIRRRGVLQPILVRETGEGATPFEIVAGERRWRAAREAGLADVPVLVLALPDRVAMEVALVENLQRHDLSALEEAEGYRRLIEELGETQERAAEAVGKSRSHIANMLRLLRLPEPVKALLAAGALSAGHARAILGAADPEALARRAVAEQLSVRETERLAQSAPLPESQPARRSVEKDPDLVAIEAELSRLFGAAVEIKLRGKGDRGTLAIRFKGLEQLHGLIERLRT